MFSIDSSKCTGCGACIEVCLQGTISVRHNVAVIDDLTCSQCGSCADICPFNAIRAVEPVYAQSVKGGGRMFYGYGRGSSGRGGAGLGFRGVSPPWPYVGRGRGGLPRCWYPGVATAFPYAPSPMPYAPGVTREQELGFLKEEAEAIRRHMEDVEARIKELETKQD